MLGYVRPFQPLPMLAPRYRLSEPANLGTSYIHDRSVVSVLPADRDVVAPIAALVDLLRLHGSDIGLMSLYELDPVTIRDVIYEALGITAKIWPLSLATASAALQPQSPLTASALGVDGLVSDLIPGAELAGQAQEMIPAVFSSIPISRHIYKMAIASGYDVALGLAIGESWFDLASATTGIMRLPLPDDVLYDGTCVVLTGWSDDRAAFRFRAVRGPDWGEKGEGWLPYDYAAQSMWCHEAVILIADGVSPGGANG